MKITCLFAIICFVSCHTPKPVAQPATTIPVASPLPPPVPVTKPGDTLRTAHNPGKTDPFLEQLLKSQPELTTTLDNRDSLKLQIIYTRIDRQAGNAPVFKSFYFNVNDQLYFYPASTVKMPVALLALQRLNELKVAGLNRKSTMITENGYGAQTSVFNDPTTEDGRPTIEQYIKKIFLVSDNDAFNRLYEFLGQQYINERLHRMGYPWADVLHRLSLPLSENDNRHTNPVSFFDPTGKMLYTQPMQVNGLPYPQRTDLVGTGYYTAEKRVDSPMVFSAKNRLNLSDLTELLRSIIFPQTMPFVQRFNITPEDQRFVLKYMSAYPSESLFPEYDSSNHWDASGKFLLYGASKEKPMKNVRIFNKIGEAYGFLTDAAYIVDFDRNIEFMLSATIYCNQDGLLNDDHYDYENIGLPFLKNLGRVLYDYETKRKRLRQPDLSGFKINYEKNEAF